MAKARLRIRKAGEVAAAIEKKRAARKAERKPIEALRKVTAEDLVRIRTCVNCGQSATAIQVTIPEGGDVKDAHMKCPACKHEWGMAEERAPHRLGLAR